MCVHVLFRVSTLPVWFTLENQIWQSTFLCLSFCTLSSFTSFPTICFVHCIIIKSLLSLQLYFLAHLFFLHFILPSTNLLYSLCYKCEITLTAPGVLKNKFNNAYKFPTWHIVGIQEVVILFSFPFKFTHALFHLTQRELYW